MISAELTILPPATPVVPTLGPAEPSDASPDPKQHPPAHGPKPSGGDGLPDAVDSPWRACRCVAAPPHRLPTASWDSSST